MAKETYKLTAPDGSHVEVDGAGRRDILLGRGYTEGHTGSGRPKATTTSDKPTGDQK